MITKSRSRKKRINEQSRGNKRQQEEEAEGRRRMKKDEEERDLFCLRKFTLLTLTL